MSSLNKPLEIALTGGIGSGKSTVCKEFEKLGIPCFSADKATHECYDDLVFQEQIRKLFGNNIFSAPFKVDKQKVAQIVFQDKSLLGELNSLVASRVWDKYHQWVEDNSDFPYVIQENAVLFEYHYEKMFHKVIGVYLEQEERIARIALRDNASREEILSRIKNQIPSREILEKADFVILNYEGNPRKRQVELIHQKILTLRNSLQY